MSRLMDQISQSIELYPQLQHKTKKVEALDDDWETAYSDGDETTTLTENAKLWNAERKPEYIIESSTTSFPMLSHNQRSIPGSGSQNGNYSPHNSIPAHSTSATRPSIPAQGIFGPPPKMMILKRPTTPSSSTNKSGNLGNGSGANGGGVKSLQQREVEYLEARSKLFGSSTSATTNTTSSSLTSPSPSTSTPTSTNTSTDSLLVSSLASLDLIPTSISKAQSRRVNTTNAPTLQSQITTPSFTISSGGGIPEGFVTSPPTNVRHSSPNPTPNSSTTKPLVGIVRQPNGPNAISGGFGFEPNVVVADSANRSNKSNGRGRGRGRGRLASVV